MTGAVKVPVFRWDDLSDEQKETIEERLIAILDKAPGLWIYGLPMERYLAIDAMSSSGLVKMRRSAAHFLHALKNPTEPTKVMREGTALHTAVLEPEEFDDTYVVIGQCEGKKKDGERCSYQGSIYRDGQSFCKTHDPAGGEPMRPDIQVIEQGALDRIKAGRDAVLNHPDAGEFFRGKGRSEVTGIWKDSDTGVPCKIRLDRDIERAAIHADVKWTADASRNGFYRIARRLGYFLKSAFYRRGMAALGRPAPGSVLVAVEQQPPHGVQAFLLDEDNIEAWGAVIDETLEQYAKCKGTGEWPGYPTGLTPLSLKSWDLPDTYDEDELLDEDNEEEG